MTIGKWADAAGHPSGASLVADGYTGVLVYGGTPGRAKNITKPVYDDYRAHGLDVAAVFEDGVNDISSGQGAGHAHALMANLLALDANAAATIPIAAAADEHLTAADVVVGVSYQRDFYSAAKASGWKSPVGGYGFSEFTRAIWAAGVAEWLWQAGSASTLWAAVTFWQRNDGAAVVGGVQVDINEQYLPIGVPDMLLTDNVRMPNWAGVDTPATVKTVNNCLAEDNVRIQQIAAAVAGLTAALAAATTNPAITPQMVADAIDAAVAAHVKVNIAVTP